MYVCTNPRHKNSYHSCSLMKSVLSGWYNFVLNVLHHKLFTLMLSKGDFCILRNIQGNLSILKYFKLGPWPQACTFFTPSEKFGTALVLYLEIKYLASLQPYNILKGWLWETQLHVGGLCECWQTQQGGHCLLLQRQVSSVCLGREGGEWGTLLGSQLSLHRATHAATVLWWMEQIENRICLKLFSWKNGFQQFMLKQTEPQAICMIKCFLSEWHHTFFRVRLRDVGVAMGWAKPPVGGVPDKDKSWKRRAVLAHAGRCWLLKCMISSLKCMTSGVWVSILLRFTCITSVKWQERLWYFKKLC